CAPGTWQSAPAVSSFRGLRRQHFATAIGIHLRHHARHFHGFDHARGPVIANAQFTLYRRNGSLAALRHKAYGLIVERIRLFTIAFAAFITKKAHALFGSFRGNAVDIMRFATLLPVGHDPMNFIVGHEGAMDTLRNTTAWRQIQHVTMSQ